MSTAETIHIPLQASWLCADCESIGNCAERCPACASEVVQSLAGILNRETEPQFRLATLNALNSDPFDHSEEEDQ